MGTEKEPRLEQGREDVVTAPDYSDEIVVLQTEAEHLNRTGWSPFFQDSNMLARASALDMHARILSAAQGDSNASENCKALVLERPEVISEALQAAGEARKAIEDRSTVIETEFNQVPPVSAVRHRNRDAGHERDRER